MSISYRAAPGHTPGHSAVEIAGERTVLIAGDAWHSPAQIAEPAWCHRADRDQAQARASRVALAEWALDNDVIVAAGHFPEHVCFGSIRAGRESGLIFDPVGA
jgi:glyoxylase-like metal-dependent hydrolase (beta-lactamase superfamily II)